MRGVVRGRFEPLVSSRARVDLRRHRRRERVKVFAFGDRPCVRRDATAREESDRVYSSDGQSNARAITRPSKPKGRPLKPSVETGETDGR